MPSVFITGVSAGIGRALADIYLQNDWDVYGISRRTPQAIVDHPNFHFRSLDLSDLAKIENLGWSEFLPAGDDVSLVYLNAGVSGDAPQSTRQCSLETINSAFSVNVLANKVLLDQLIPRTKKGACFVLSASVAGKRFRSGMLSYSISKSALLALCGVYAKEHPHRSFLAIGMCNVDTSFSRSIVFNPRSAEFSECYALQHRFKQPGYAVSPNQRADDLFYLFSSSGTELSSGEFYDIRDLLRISTPLK